jgi:hypothetical protein
MVLHQSRKRTHGGESRRLRGCADLSAEKKAEHYATKKIGKPWMISEAKKLLVKKVSEISLIGIGSTCMPKHEGIAHPHVYEFNHRELRSR